MLVRLKGNEKASLDRRERNYDPKNVSALVRAKTRLPTGARVVTYLPREESVERFRRALDQKRLRVSRSYLQQVHQGFEELGGDQLARFAQKTGPIHANIEDLQMRSAAEHQGVENAQGIQDR